MEELSNHGYLISAGTLYLNLHNMGKKRLIYRTSRLYNGKIRKYYYKIEFGDVILNDDKVKIYYLIVKLMNK